MPCVPDSSTQGDVLTQLPGVQLRVTPGQVQPADIFRQGGIPQRAEKCKLCTRIPQGVQRFSVGKAEGFIPRYGNANGGRARRGKRRRSRGRTVGQYCQLCPVQHKGIGKLAQLLL